VDVTLGGLNGAGDGHRCPRPELPCWSVPLGSCRASLRSFPRLGSEPLPAGVGPAPLGTRGRAAPDAPSPRPVIRSKPLAEPPPRPHKHGHHAYVGVGDRVDGVCCEIQVVGRSVARTGRSRWRGRGALGGVDSGPSVARTGRSRWRGLGAIGGADALHKSPKPAPARRDAEISAGVVLCARGRGGCRGLARNAPERQSGGEPRPRDNPETIAVLFEKIRSVQVGIGCPGPTRSQEQ